MRDITPISAISEIRGEGSPFVVGRPLRPDEPIFGREEAFAFLGAQLANFSSVNLIGERRMGKTSVLNHLLGNQKRYLTFPATTAPLMIRLDLQAGVTSQQRFYGTILRELPRASNASGCSGILKDKLQHRLDRTPEATGDEFDVVLRNLADASPRIRPVVAIDEFEVVLELADAFPVQFFNGLRAWMMDRLTLVIASRVPLAQYFMDGKGGLTSTFPTYFQPFELGPMGDEAASSVLLQTSEHSLLVAEANEARRWARGHPCHLQAAGEAWYQAKANRHGREWAFKRREEIKRQNCMVVPQGRLKGGKPGLARRAANVFVGMKVIARVKPETVMGWIKVMTIFIVAAVLVVLLLAHKLSLKQASDFFHGWLSK